MMLRAISLSSGLSTWLRFLNNTETKALRTWDREEGWLKPEMKAYRRTSAIYRMIGCEQSLYVAIILSGHSVCPIGDKVNLSDTVERMINEAPEIIAQQQWGNEDGYHSIGQTGLTADDDCDIKWSLTSNHPINSQCTSLVLHFRLQPSFLMIPST